MMKVIIEGDSLTLSKIKKLLRGFKVSVTDVSEPVSEVEKPVSKPAPKQLEDDEFLIDKPEKAKSKKTQSTKKDN